MDDQDEIEIRRFYANLSTQIRMFGAEQMGRRYVVVRLARMEVNSNLTFSDLQRILTRVVDAPAWYPAFHEEAIDAEERARDYARPPATARRSNRRPHGQ